ncbi:hypothetical protein ACN268_00270 [Micromonospora sp. WMMD735]|uniref:hypothetical protein n=1 Tax=Micromonospora sp. WMMD735 TaxID=3404130 RepID=UPI003B9480C7
MNNNPLAAIFGIAKTVLHFLNRPDVKQGIAFARLAKAQADADRDPRNYLAKQQLERAQIRAAYATIKTNEAIQEQNQHRWQ